MCSRLLFLTLFFFVSAAQADEAWLKTAKDTAVRTDLKETIQKIKETIQNNPAYQQGMESAEKLENERAQFKIESNTDNNAPLADLQGVDINRLMGRYQNKLNSATTQTPKLNRLIIFISLSMPANSLKQLDAQAREAGGLLVLRGLINNSYKDTVATLSGMTDKGINAVIDPRLFEVYAVEAVPAFVVNPNEVHPCFESKCKMTPLHDKISGDMSLEYALQQIAEHGENAAPVANEYLNILRREHD